MGLELNLNLEEMGIELARQDENGVSKWAVPPTPPAKEAPKRPPPLNLEGSRPGSSSSSDAPNRPLPPRPTTLTVDTSSDAPRRPPPLRPPPPRPQAPLGMNPPTRPGTAASQATSSAPRITGSTKRLSWASVASTRRPIKYGQGKYRHIELVPQPSDDPDDPLNWPTWRKELNFASLLLMVAMTGVMKTVFVSVNGQLAEMYEVSYTAVAALTGAPLIVSSLTGFTSLIASRICGKRPLYLVSLLLVFIGAVWNTNVMGSGSFGQCMAARIFQGLGWGAFDSLVLGSIQDTYFEHERGVRIAVYSIVAVATTWGPPLIGGVASQHSTGFSLQFTILSTFFVVAVPAICLGCPETVFDRAYTLAQAPPTGASTSSGYKQSQPLVPRRLWSLETANEYIVKMKPLSYRGSTDVTTLLQAPRALVAPTTVLLFLVSFLPYGILWGFAGSLSLLFSPMPFMLTPGNIGILMAGPWLMGSIAVGVFGVVKWWGQNFTPRLHMAAVAGGTVLVFVGVLTFGLHIDACMTRPEGDPGTTSMFALDYLGKNVSFPALSFVLGLLTAGVYTLDAATVAPLVRASTMFTSSNLGVALRNTTDMGAGVGIWRQLFAGVFVIAVPNAVWSWDGLRALCIGVAIAQVVIAALVGSVWWLWDEDIRRWDGKIMRLVDLDMLKRTGSFFDTD
ncbi:major facilitator superfamily domain-containing protein [Diplogelasinospora grovesii]|uniref:Major facilitator superfamily domain-containing protein n=1 Tax=Diplogelasinospora grovesii TaxID=303347 RepID=A0AAN6N8S6_9PEZI|nr:major facilitator superfamily domain-containing protein [Diplogelasinospora grovesii]